MPKMAHNQSSALYIIDQEAFEKLYLNYNQYDVSGSSSYFKNMAPEFTSLNYDEIVQWLTNYANMYYLKTGDILHTPSRHGKMDVWVWHASKGPIRSTVLNINQPLCSQSAPFYNNSRPPLHKYDGKRLDVILEN